MEKFEVFLDDLAGFKALIKYPLQVYAELVEGHSCASGNPIHLFIETLCAPMVLCLCGEYFQVNTISCINVQLVIAFAATNPLVHAC